ncbi:hypothetical protein [Natrinema versiforme]|uniref:hypothetical protein n=1 Tax=Natrinema versiforme TaxID=88724 RepID=UPI0015868189|nr:hypothetical protein [Natrinema versiforme]
MTDRTESGARKRFRYADCVRTAAAMRRGQRGPGRGSSDAKRQSDAATDAAGGRRAD